MRERGQYQLQLMKTRSSSGVGQKIELAFDVETLRITDPESDNNTNDDVVQQSGNDIMKQIKAASTVTDNVEPVVKNIQGEVKSAKLKSLLNQLKN
jgi:hypothetical protein